MDRISKSQRSRNMSRVKGADTKLELLVRKYLFKRGLRYKLKYSLKGKPDIVFPSKKVVIFIHGCFWHQHTCKRAKLPVSNSEFWKNKLEGNRVRDKKTRHVLEEQGWNVLTLWQCELEDNLEEQLEPIVRKLKNT